MSTFTAQVFTAKPSATSCDMYVELPTIRRYPVLLEDFNDKLLTLALHAVKAGFVTLTQGPSVSPMFVSNEVITAAYEALKPLQLDIENRALPVTLYVGFKERRLIAVAPIIKVQSIKWVNEGVPETPNPYLLAVCLNGLTKAHLHSRLAVEGLENAKGDMKIFNADVVNDPQSASFADSLTAALHDAIDNIPDTVIADLEKSRSGERTPIMVEFLAE